VFALFDLPVSAAYHVVSLLASGAATMFGELGVPVAIVLFTAGIRLLLHPLARAAVRGERARAALAPQMRELRKRYGGDPRRLNDEMAALYQRSGTSLAAGCLPMLLQLPFFTVMYRLFVSSSIAGAPNSLLGHTVFGARLDAHFLGLLHAQSFGVTGLVFLGLFTALATVAFFTIRWQAARAGGTDTPTVPGAGLLRLLPYGTVLVAAAIPLAAGIYLLTSTTWTAVERALLHGEHADVATTGSP